MERSSSPRSVGQNHLTRVVGMYVEIGKKKKTPRNPHRLFGSERICSCSWSVKSSQGSDVLDFDEVMDEGTRLSEVMCGIAVSGGMSSDKRMEPLFDTLAAHLTQRSTGPLLTCFPMSVEVH